MPFGSILAAWSSLGSYFGCLDIILEALDHILEALDVILEALGDILGMAWVLDWPRGPEWAGLHSGSSVRSVLVDPGIQGTAQVQAGFGVSGPYYQRITV